MVENKKKTIELWEGYEVEVDEGLLKDADYIFDLEEAVKEGSTREVITMLFALVGGEEVYDAAHNYIVNKCGKFDIDEIGKISEKISDCLPKAGNRASRRQKWTRR